MTNAREVISACLQNDAAAQKRLYDYYAPQMLQVCYRYTKNQEETSAVFQEGFVRAFRSLHQWKEEGELGAWIRNIMVNTALDWLDDNKRMLWTSDGQFSADQVKETPAYLLQDKDGMALADIARQLPGAYQAIFNLHAIDGYSLADTAKLLNISEADAGSQYLRARAYFSGLLEQSETDKNIRYARN